MLFSKFQKFEKKNSPVLITYGSPRVGNKEFVNKIDEKVPYIFRVVKHHDIVPTLPPQFGKNSFKHTRGLIMIPDDRQNLFYCDTIEKKQCENEFFFVNLFDVQEHHSYYFYTDQKLSEKCEKAFKIKIKN